MEKGIATGFTDKNDRIIHVGDILQHRLGKFGKSGGSKNFKVIVFGKKYHIVDEFVDDAKFGGGILNDAICRKVVVIRCDHALNL